MSRRKKTTSVNLPLEMFFELRQVAASQMRSAGQIVEFALRDYFKALKLKEERKTTDAK